MAALSLAGCAERPPPPVATAPTATGTAQPATAPVAHAEPTAIDWSHFLGRCIVVQGYAGGGAKTGARLETSAGPLELRLASPVAQAEWEAFPPGGLVQTQGVVVEERDPRVFVAKPDGPIEQGIPVPEGTDLGEASKRYVLTDAHAELLRTLADVDAALAAEVGHEVRLLGIVWSRNGQWWLRHDGVDLHVEGAASLPSWHEMHGRATTLVGRLERRPMPRIDQIGLKADRDRSDAFVLAVKELGPAPPAPIRECPVERAGPRG